MNYFDFKKILDADPHNKSPDFLQAIQDDITCRRAYKQAMEEESILSAALNIPVPQSDIDRIRFSQTHQNHNRNKQYQWMALAASMFVVFGFGLIFYKNNQATELERFINEALLMEPAVYMSEAEIPHQELEPLFASINTAIDGDLGQVHFMKLCPTLEGTGARMVVMNDLNQPITVLYMPNSPVEEAINMQMEGFKGKIVALEQGSAAIIARPHQNTAQVEHTLFNALKPLN